MGHTIQELLLGLRGPDDPDAVTPDTELLDRFARLRDDAAFSVLVARHGPMVLGVARRLLGDPHEVADAFQATFLVLARKAGTLGRADSV